MHSHSGGFLSRRLQVLKRIHGAMKRLVARAKKGI